MKYNLDRLNREPILNLSIFEAAIDWGYEQQEAEQPEQIPYYCELTAIWYDKQLREDMPRAYIQVSTHGLIYASASSEDPKKFGNWDLSRFEIDHIANSDKYDIEQKQDNTQGFEFYSLYEYENNEEISQKAADTLEYIVRRHFAGCGVTIDYPNGILNLVGFEK